MIPRVYQPGWFPRLEDAALADRERRAGGEHHANDERNAPALAPLDAEEPGEPHLGILAVVAPPRCKPQPKPQGPTGAAAQAWSVPGAQELSAMNAIQHDRLGEAKVFTKPRRPSSWDYPEAVEAGRWGNGRHRC